MKLHQKVSPDAGQVILKFGSILWPWSGSRPNARKLENVVFARFAPPGRMHGALDGEQLETRRKRQSCSARQELQSRKKTERIHIPVPELDRQQPLQPRERQTLHVYHRISSALNWRYSRSRRATLLLASVDVRGRTNRRIPALIKEFFACRQISETCADD